MKFSIQKMIKLGESETLEFKSSFNREVIETACAFANRTGGTILIGVDDSACIVGVPDNAETAQKWLNEIKQNSSPSIIPDIEAFHVDGKTVVAIHVSEFPVKPVACRDRYFKRIANSNHRLNLTEIANLHLQSLQLSWDAYAPEGGSLDQLSNEKIARFMKRVEEGGRFTIGDDSLATLEKLGYLKDNVPTHAALFLFGKNDPPYNVHIGRFKTPSMIIDDRMIRGTLFEVAEEAMRFITSHLRVAFEITGEKLQRTEIFDYPRDALRELLFNAIVHRDYMSPTDIQIKIFDQSILFFNPGKLYGGLTIEELNTDNYQARTRNKLIAEAFYLTCDTEKYGSGFRRIRSAIAEYPTMQFSYRESGDGFITELQYQEQKVQSKGIPEKVGEKVTTTPKTTQDTTQDTTQENNLGEVKQKILHQLRENPKMTRQELTGALGKSDATIKEHIAKLKALGILERVGSTKGGMWHVKNQKK